MPYGVAGIKADWIQRKMDMPFGHALDIKCFAQKPSVKDMPFSVLAVYNV